MEIKYSSVYIDKIEQNKSETDHCRQVLGFTDTCNAVEVIECLYLTSGAMGPDKTFSVIFARNVSAVVYNDL